MYRVIFDYFTRCYHQEQIHRQRSQNKKKFLIIRAIKRGM